MLIVNTLMIGLTICLYALVTAQTPLAEIIAIGLALGFFNSLQFSSINSMAYADIETHESSMASTIASSFQQISMSFGLAFGSLVGRRGILEICRSPIASRSSPRCIALS